MIFTNVDTKTEFTYFFNSIKKIEDADGNIVYSQIPINNPNNIEVQKDKNHIYPKSNFKNTLRADILFINNDTLYTNIKISTNLFDSDLINELSFNKKILVVENDTKTKYEAKEIKQLKFTDYKYKERIFVLKGEELVEQLYDGRIKWYRYYYSNSSGNVSSGDYMTNEANEGIGVSYLFNTKKSLKNITKAKPELISLIENS